MICSGFNIWLGGWLRSSHPIMSRAKRPNCKMPRISDTFWLMTQLVNNASLYRTSKPDGMVYIGEVVREKRGQNLVYQ